MSKSKISISRILIGAVLGLVSLISLLPYINILAVSFSSAVHVDSGNVTFWPQGFTLVNYETVLKDISLIRAFMVSVCLTLAGTAFSLIMTSLLAYPLSRNEFRFKKVCLSMIVFTFVFSAPLIPNFLWIKTLGLYNSLWALIIPSGIHTFNFFILRSFFMQIPEELLDAAKVDGCSEVRTLTRVILPLSKPVMATLGLMYGVSYWNNYMTPLYYINNRLFYPLQLRLWEIIVGAMDFEVSAANLVLSPYALKMTTILLATLPVILIYPFLQKYFVKGMTLGSLKE